MRTRYDEYDVVVVFACGEPGTLEGNIALSRHGAWLRTAKGLLVFDQMVFLNMWPKLGNAEHQTTLKFVKAFSLEARKQAWKRVLVVAAPDHAPRCVRDLRKCGFEAEADYCFQEMEKLFFSSLSEQWWTRRRWVCVLREYILLSLPWWFYKRIRYIGQNRT